MNQDKFSIILPVYNRENTIKGCIDSILSQSYTELELLIVKVTTEDHTWKICKKYAGKDNRVKLIDNRETTPGSAMNQALKIAEGRWLLFIDGADEMASDYLRKLYEKQQKKYAPLLVSNFCYKDREGEMAYSEKAEGEISRETYMQQLMKDPTHVYFGALWNKLYDAELIQKHAMTFPEKVQWGEDFIFNMQYLAFAETVYIKDLVSCYYTTRDMTADITGEWHLIDWLNHRNYMYAAYKTLFWRVQCYTTYKREVEHYMLQQAAIEFAHIILPFSFKGWCLIRKKCLQDNQLNTVRNRLWVMIKGVKLRFGVSS